MAKPTKANVALLAVIVAATNNGTEAPFHMATRADLANLLEHGLVEVNDEIVEGDTVAVRATEKGQAESNPAGAGTEGNTNTVTNAAATAATAASAFALISGVELPTGRAPRSNAVYPFDAMEVGQSFFVEATAEKEDPAASLASTVSSANKRFSTPTGEKKTETRPVYQTGADGKRVKGDDGKLIKTGEKTVEVDVLKPGKTFAVKAVKAGVAYGAWTAPADGALVQRTA